MNLLRRPEIAVLLTLVLAGLLWVAFDQRARNPSQIDGSTRGSIDGLRDLRITRALVVPDGLHRRLRLDFTARHEASAPIEVRSPDVRLFDATGAEVPVFFVPGDFPPALPPGADAASWLEFWLTESQAAGALIFEVAGHRTAVPEERTTATGG